MERKRRIRDISVDPWNPLEKDEPWRWSRKLQKPALPKPTEEEILNMQRLADCPEDFEMQDPESIFVQALLRDGTPSRQLAGTNPDRIWLRTNSFVVKEWCPSGRVHGYQEERCTKPHPGKVGLVITNDRADWVSVKPLYSWSTPDNTLILPHERLRGIDSVETTRLLWVRALRNPFYHWSPRTHLRAPKALRRAVKCIVSIRTIERDHMLGALPNELLFIIFEMLADTPNTSEQAAACSSKPT